MVSQDISEPKSRDWHFSGSTPVAEDFMRASVSDCKILCLEIRRRSPVTAAFGELRFEQWNGDIMGEWSGLIMVNFVVDHIGPCNS